MPTIIYAEDDAEHRAMMRIALQNTNITLIEAADGNEALTKIEAHHPDLILLDLFMPHLDGFGVMEAVKAHPINRYIPIIVLSAWPTGDNRQRTSRAGATHFVAKPYDPLALVNLIKQTLAGQPRSFPVNLNTGPASLPV